LVNSNGHGAGGVLVEHRLAVRVGLPERAGLPGLGHREPAAQRALDVRREVFFLQQEGHELLGARFLFLPSLNTTPVFTAVR
jgi:hypothetical protein